METGKICAFIDEDWPEKLESLLDENRGWPEAERVPKGTLALYIGSLREFDDRLCVVRIPGLDGEWVTERSLLVMLEDCDDT